MRLPFPGKVSRITFRAANREIGDPFARLARFERKDLLIRLNQRPAGPARLL